MEITRRALGTGAAAIAAAGVLGSTEPASAATRQRIVGVDVSRHPVPMPANLQQVLSFDPAYLDRLAQRYWDDYARHLNRPLDVYDRADFWFRYVAIPLQEKALLGHSLGHGDQRVEKDLAVMHMVGYYGGIWFGKKLKEFLGSPTTSRCQAPQPGPTASDFTAMAAALTTAVARGRDGSAAQAIEAAEVAIRGGDIASYYTSGIPASGGLIGGYSYNVGYTNAILIPDNRALPPPLNPKGPTLYSPPWNSMLFTNDGIFDATYPVWADARTATTIAPTPPGGPPFTPVPYLVGDFAPLKIARPLFDAAVAARPADYQRIVAGILDRHGNVVARGNLNLLSQNAFDVGTATWTGVPTLNVRPWDDPSYNLLIALSIGYVQALQAPGQACIAAAINNDEMQARNALMAYAVSAPFGLAYLVALNRGDTEGFACYTADESIPPFVLGPESAAAGPARTHAGTGRRPRTPRTARPTAPSGALAATGVSREQALVAGALTTAGLIGLRRRRGSDGAAGPGPDARGS